MLNVEVEMANLSSTESLDFRGWSADSSAAADSRVVLVDDAGRPLQPASSPSTRDRSGTMARRLRPAERHIEQLVFVLPERESAYYRLALPYAAIGHSGYLGFEIPRQMIKDQPPEPDDVAAAPAASQPEPAAAEPSLPRTDEPETIDQLREAIKESVGDPDAEAASPPPGRLQRETTQPETVSDLRRAIESDAQDDEEPSDP
jgi:hypothetical protein